jgi:autotransporter-associated beta strand protein
VVAAVAFVAAWNGAAEAQTLAFPEAEGFGRFATGARTSLASASVYRVTNLNDSGAGSFRDAVSQSNRFVVFDVGGVVTLNSTAVVSSNVTIAGQTAPGGFALYGDRLAFTGANNSISRYLAVRKGEAGTREDTVNLSRGSNIMFDHMSVTWGVDETFSMNPATGQVIDNITIQNTVIAQGLDRLGHSAGGLMTLGEGSRFSIVKSLFADNVTRNPKVRGENEFINNVIYGYETAGYIMGDTVNMSSHANAIGNYFIEGPVDGSSPFASGTPQFEIYGADNWVDGDRDGLLDGSRITTYPGATVAATPFAFPTTASMTAQQAVSFVTQHAGPTITRDEVDTRIMQGVLSYGTLGGVILRDTDLFPTFASPRVAFGRLADTDNDGMPDGWERSRGLNPASATDWKTLSGGYTNLELYLNELGANETASRWTVASGTWGGAGSWSGGVPTFSTAAAVSGTAGLATGQALARRLSIGDGGPGRLNVTGGSLDIFERLHLGPSSDGTLSITGGSVAAGEIVLGGLSGTTPTAGLLVMTGGTLQAAFMRAGSAGGRFDWTAGAVHLTASPNIAVPTVVGPAGGTIATNGFSGTWSGVLTGSGGLTKNGAGTLTLTGSNSLLGNVRVNAGTLALNHVAAAGPGTILLGGGEVAFGSVSGIATPIVMLASGTLSAGGITLNGAISGSASHRLGIATTTTGNLTLAGSLAGFAGTLDFGPSSGNVRLNASAATGSGTAQFDLGVSTAAIRTAFAATVQVGSLTGGTGTKLQGATNDAGAVTYVIGGNSRSTSFAGTITNGVFTTPGIVGLTKTGTGTLTLSGGSSAFTGVTRVSGGTLSVAVLANGGTASGIGSSSADPASLVLDGGALHYTGPAVTIDRGFTVTANGGRFERHGVGNLVLGGTASIAMPGSGDRTLVLGGSSTAFNSISAGIGDPASGRTTLVKDGPGTWRLGGASSFTGGTGLRGGSIVAAASGALGSGVVTLSGSAQRLTLVSSATLANAIVIDAPAGVVGSGLIQYEGLGRGVLAGGTITILANNPAGGIFGSTGGGELVVSSAVVAASGSRVNVRTGTVTLGGGGSYQYLDHGTGTLRVGAPQGIATTAEVLLGASGPAVFDLAGFDQTIARLTKGPAAAVTGNSSTTRNATLTITGSATYDGVLQDAVLGGTRLLHLAVDGGRLRLTAANTHSGTTSVGNGTLWLDHAASLGGSRLRLLAGGTATLGQAGSLAVTAVEFAGGMLDIAAGRIEIAAGGIDPTMLVAQLTAGRGAGSWTGGTGISSAAVASAVAGGDSRAVGWMANDDGSLSVAATAPGDANLDGVVDILDAALVVTADLFNKPSAAVWAQGDFTYDGVVDILDVSEFLSGGLFDQGAFGTSGVTAPVVSVPEPTVPAQALLAAVLLTMTAVRSSAWRAPAAKSTTAR